MKQIETVVGDNVNVCIRYFSQSLCSLLAFLLIIKYIIYAALM